MWLCLQNKAKKVNILLFTSNFTEHHVICMQIHEKADLYEASLSVTCLNQGVRPVSIFI